MAAHKEIYNETNKVLSEKNANGNNWFQFKLELLFFGNFDWEAALFCLFFEYEIKF